MRSNAQVLIDTGFSLNGVTADYKPKAERVIERVLAAEKGHALKFLCVGSGRRISAEEITFSQALTFGGTIDGELLVKPTEHPDIPIRSDAWILILNDEVHLFPVAPIPSS